MSCTLRYAFRSSSLISSSSFAICWAQVSFVLTVVVRIVGALDAVSFGMSSTAVLEPVVERAVVDRVGEFGGWPGHSRAMWPF